MTTPLWIYKNNSRSTGGPYGIWTEFFDLAGRRKWGTTAYIGRHNRDTAFEMAPGDQVLCWQTNRRHAVGLALVIDLPESDVDGSVERDFVLEPIKRFSPPVPLLDLRRTNPDLAAVRAFTPGFVKTIYRTSPEEARAILDACGVAPVASARVRRVQRANADSERAGVDHVTAVFEADGWTVTSVERDKVGYDLHATRRRQELHLEVKGTVGVDANFFLTANEHRRANEDSKWRLCLVRSALDPKRRQLDIWTGDELLEQGDFAPASYRVSMKENK